MDLVKLLTEFVSKSAKKEGINETSIPGVRCLKFSKPSERLKGEWPRSFVIVAQGTKEIQLENSLYTYSAPHFVATPIPLQVTSRVKQASPLTPYLALLINFDSILLTEVARQMDFNFEQKPKMYSHGLFAGRASSGMLECAIRLAKLLISPEDSKILAPLALREMYYHLLRSPEGKAIHQLAQSGSKMQKIAQIIYDLTTDLTLTIDVQELANQVSMSRSTFFRSFHEITAMSPIQYQKRLRLNEAKRLLIDENETAEGAAFKVGYKSSSQFSREYSRMFGDSPIRDIAKVQNRSASSDQD